jgi:hypothetical protein
MFRKTSKCEGFCNRLKSTSFNATNKSPVSWCFFYSRYCVAFAGKNNEFIISSVLEEIINDSFIFGLVKLILRKIGFKFKVNYKKVEKKFFGSFESLVFGFENNYKKISTKGTDKEVHIKCMWFADGT